jgi:hypothetical protein
LQYIFELYKEIIIYLNFFLNCQPDVIGLLQFFVFKNKEIHKSEQHKKLGYTNVFWRSFQKGVASTIFLCHVVIQYTNLDERDPILG